MNLYMGTDMPIHSWFQKSEIIGLVKKIVVDKGCIFEMSTKTHLEKFIKLKQLKEAEEKQSKRVKFLDKSEEISKGLQQWIKENEQYFVRFKRDLDQSNPGYF